MENKNLKDRSLNKSLKMPVNFEGKASENFTRSFYILAIILYLHVIPLVVLIVGFLIAMTSASLDNNIKLPDAIAKFRFVDDYYLNMPITMSLILYFIVALVAGSVLGLISYMRYNTIELPKIISLSFAFIITLSFALVALLPVFVMLALSGGSGGYFIGIFAGDLATFVLIQFFIIFGLSFLIAMRSSKKDL